MLTVIKHSVYFSDLDNSFSMSFALILIGLTSVVYLAAMLLPSQDTDETQSQDTSTPDLNLDLNQVEINPLANTSANGMSQPVGAERNGAGSSPDQALALSDPSDMLSDPDNPSSSAKRQDLLCHAFQCRLAPLVESWCLERNALEVKLRTKAMEYLLAASLGRSVFLLCSLEGKYSQSSLMVFLLQLVTTPQWRHMCSVAMFTFLGLELIQDKSWQLGGDVGILCLFTVDTCVWRLSHFHAVGQIVLVTWCYLAVVLTLWVFLTVHQAYGVNMGVVRPLLLLAWNGNIRMSLYVLCRCIYDSVAIIAMLLIVIGLSGQVVNLLYIDRFTQGHCLDTFFQSYIEMFVYLTSLDNFNDIVWQAYAISRWSACIFLPLAVMGLYFLMSMVIACFGRSYEENKHILTQQAANKSTIDLAATFVLWNWLAPLNPHAQGRSHKEISKADFVTFMHMLLGIESEDATLKMYSEAQSSRSIEFVFDQIDRDKSTLIVSATRTNFCWCYSWIN